jgi:hypothetical protein
MAIPATTAEILTLVGNDPLSDAQTLQLYKLARDQIAFSIHNSDAVTYLEIRNRRVQLSDPKDTLEFIENTMIPRYEAKVAQARGTSARNKVAFKRR